MLHRCSASRPLALRELELVNVFFTIDARTLPHLRSLRILSPTLTPAHYAGSRAEWSESIGLLLGTGIELRELVMRMDRLRSIDRGTLQYFASYSGLEGLHLVDVDNHMLSQLFTSAILIPKHANTLEELHICMDNDLESKSYELDVDHLAAFVRLRTLRLCVWGVIPEDIPVVLNGELMTPIIVSSRLCLELYPLC